MDLHGSFIEDVSVANESLRSVRRLEDPWNGTGKIS